VSEISEYNWLMSSAPGEDVKIHTDGLAMGQRIADWLATPEGSLADIPGWGNGLFSFKHEPSSENLQVMAELHLFEKLLRDIEDLDIRHISVEFPGIDMLKITITTSTDVFEEVVTV